MFWKRMKFEMCELLTFRIRKLARLGNSDTLSLEVEQSEIREGAAQDGI